MIRIRRYFWEFLIIVFALILYANTIKNDYCLDDEFVTNGNPQIAQGLSAMPNIFTSFYQQNQGFTYGYRPLVKSTFAIEYSVFSWNPHISHAINVILYAILGLILFRLTKRIFKDENTFFAIAIVLIFLAHPLHTEVVASLKNRDELLSAIFSFVSLLFFINSLQKLRVLNVLLGLMFLFLALLSKLSALPLIVIVPLVLFYLSEKSKIEKVNKFFSFSVFVKRTVPWIAAATLILYSVLVIWVIKGNNETGIIISRILLVVVFLIAVPRYYQKKSSESINIKQFFFWLPAILFSAYILTILALMPSLLGYVILGLLLATFYYFTFSNYTVSNMQLVQYLKKMPLYVSYSMLLLLIALLFLLIGKTLPSASSGAQQEYELLYWQNPLYYNTGNLEILSTTAASLFFYVKMLIFPFNLAFYYGFNMLPVGINRVEVWVSLIAIPSLLIFSLIAFVRKRNIAAFGFLFFVIAISMYSNMFAPVAGIVAERHAFFASYGFCIALTYGGFKLLRIRSDFQKINPLKKILPFILGLIILIPFSIKTISRNSEWKNHLTLFSSDIGRLENSVKANDLMAAALYRDVMRDISTGKKDGSVRTRLEKVYYYYSCCTKVYPSHYKAWNNMGMIKANFFRDYFAASRDFINAVKYKTDFVEGYSNLGYCLFMAGDLNGSVNAYKQAIALAPDSVMLLSSLSNVYFKTGDTVNAIEINNRIMAIDKGSQLPYLNMASFALSKGDTIRALGFFEDVFRINPSNKEVSLFMQNYFMRHGQPGRAAMYKINR